MSGKENLQPSDSSPSSSCTTEPYTTELQNREDFATQPLTTSRETEHPSRRHNLLRPRRINFDLAARDESDIAAAAAVNTAVQSSAVSNPRLYVCNGASFRFRCPNGPSGWRW